MASLSELVPDVSAAPSQQEEALPFYKSKPIQAAALGVAIVGGSLLARKPLWFALKGLGKRLPQELPILGAAPQSAAISETERFSTNIAGAANNVVKQPWSTLFHQRTNPSEWVTAEQKAFDTWRKLGETPVAKRMAYQVYPEDMRGGLLYLEKDLRPQEQWAAQFVRETGLHDEPYPYLPHITERAQEEIIRISRAKGDIWKDIKTTLGPFEKPRPFATMAEGIAAGEEYIDPRMALAQRIWAGQKLVQTAKYLQSLEQKGVIFREPEAAMARYGKSIPLEGMPGKQDWYAGTMQEARFIRDQLKAAQRGGLRDLVSKANLAFRNPNLYNPLPHFTKNMLYKYGWSGGKFHRVFQDMNEIRTNANPELVKRFREVMPFEMAGRTGDEVFLDLMSTIQGGKTAKVLKALTAPNRWSSKMIFTKLDPWLRYARWKQYVQQGLTDQEAANHVWIDLVRYGTRSDLVDFWKSIPLNFFVPWRVGTITSFIKNAKTAPVYTALWIGGVDLLREAIYRRTGWWVHTPIDYIEAPIAKLISQSMRDPKKEPETMAAIAATTGMFGPGGQNSVFTIEAALKGLRTGDLSNLTNMFWGLAILNPLDPYGAVQEMYAFSQDHDPKHLVKVFSMGALGAHDAIERAPYRMGMFAPLPEKLTSERVRTAENLQDIRRSRMERRSEKFVSPSVGQMQKLWGGTAPVKKTLRELVGD